MVDSIKICPGFRLPERRIGPAYLRENVGIMELIDLLADTEHCVREMGGRVRLNVKVNR